MRKPLRLLKKLPEFLKNIIHPNLDKFKSFNLYFQDESRFGLKTYVGRCLTASDARVLLRAQRFILICPYLPAAGRCALCG